MLQAALEDVNVTPKQEPLDIPLKKTKLEDSPLRYLADFYNPALLYQFSQLSRSQPWLSAVSPKHIIPPFGQSITTIPYMPTSQEPPVLQNPERVVRHTESERFERTYQPNVALAPRQTVLTKEREREREFDKDREPTERASSVIKCEIQIKQERPATPSNESPELRNNSPETTSVSEANGVAPAAPISPEGQSGSNEITSSTSPVPANIPNKQESMSPPPSSQTSPSLASPRSHLLNHTLHKSPSSVVVKVSTNQPNTLTNGNKKLPIIGNPEFELSTDTDEESLGEPDSSNVNGLHAQTAYEYAKLLLKNNSVDDREKILDLIKYMEKEITQLKDLHKKEIREMQQQQQQKEESFRKTIESLQFSSRPSNGLSNNNSSVIATSCLSSSSSSSSSSLSSSSSYDYDRSERRNSIVEKPNVIIKPLKKSLRITPILDDCKPTANNNITSQPSIVIVPKREDIINNNNTKLYNHNNNNNNATIVNGQTESLDDTLKKTAIKAEKL